ncbi:MAG: hypothetical protein NDJ92_10245 [Thermoanaerobaculia bacterium]|nr:hypothetical protein [Thermoanaerobaculia bacterium]
MLGRDSLKERHLTLLTALAASARQAGARAFLVGGPVRDLLLRAPMRDLDFAVEGDTEATARAFADAAGAALRPFSEFLTFKALLPGGEELDIATTRRERYPRPGALPLVEPASIGEDLRRRDFSANAIALDLESWEIVDPTGGVDDLEHGRLRVLHARSFVDDPTRIFRGIRLSARLGLAWERESDRLVSEAIEGGAIACVSRERVWRELRIAAEEQRGAGAALLAMARRGALERFLGVGPEPEESEPLGYLDTRQDLLTATGANPRIVRFALLLAGSKPDNETLHGASFSGKETGTMLSLARNPRGLASDIEQASDDAARYLLLDAASPEACAVTALVRPACEELVTRFVQVAEVDLGVRGDGLGVPPGPWVGAALRTARQAVFARVISTGEAPAFARRAAVDYLRRQDRNE